MSIVLTDRPSRTDLAQQAAARQLSILGGLQPSKGDPVPDGTRSLLLLGPAEPGFWAAFQKSPEAVDGCADPLDRWSRRVIDAWAVELGGEALFPFDGTPWLPFIDWARRSGRAWASPVTFLVHADAGLFLSIRGAVALPWKAEGPPTAERPCDAGCNQPCLAACPVAALGPAGYDVSACHSFLDQPAGRACLEAGCAARRVCPVSQIYPRQTAQSAFHMSAFHGPR